MEAEHWLRCAGSTGAAHGAHGADGADRGGGGGSAAAAAGRCRFISRCSCSFGCS